MYSKFLILLMGLLAFSSSMLASRTDSTTCLEIKGRVLKLSESDTRYYKTELVYNGQVIDSATVKDKKAFRFKLRKNTVYGIRIEKAGFVPRYISIDTRLPEYATRSFSFEFDTELIKVEDSKNLNLDALDFPVAIIFFHNDLKCFYYDEEYTAGMKRKIYLGKEF